MSSLLLRSSALLIALALVAGCSGARTSSTTSCRVESIGILVSTGSSAVDVLLEEFYESHESGTGLSPQSGVAGVVDSDPSVQTAQLLLRPSMGAEVVDADLLPRLIAREVVELVEYRCGDESMTVYQRP